MSSGKKINTEDAVRGLLRFFEEGPPLDSKLGKAEITSLVKGYLGVACTTRLFKNKEKYHSDGYKLIRAWEQALIDLICELPGGTRHAEEWLKSHTTPGGITDLENRSASVGKSKSSGLSEYEKYMKLLRKLAKLEQQNVPLQATVKWVATYIDLYVGDLEVAKIPGCEALSTWWWAKTSKTEFHRTFNNKRVPAKGFASDGDKGLMDDGKLVGEIRSGIISGMNSFRENRKGELTDVEIRAMRSLQENEEDGTDPDTVRGVSELLEQVAQ